MASWMNETEVIEMAFDRRIENGKIDDQMIESVQVHHLLPVLGKDFYNAIDDDTTTYSAVITQVKAMLAYLVKYYVLPRLHIETGTVGMARIQGQNRTPANQNDYEKQRMDALEMAELHGEKLKKWLYDNESAYPLYFRGSNPQERINHAGGIIMRENDPWFDPEEDDYTIGLTGY